MLTTNYRKGNWGPGSPFRPPVRGPAFKGSSNPTHLHQEPVNFPPTRVGGWRDGASGRGQPAQASLLGAQSQDPSSGHPRSAPGGGDTCRHPRPRHPPLPPYLEARPGSARLHPDRPRPDPNSFLNSLPGSLKPRARARASSAVAGERSHDAPPCSRPLWSCDCHGRHRRKPGSRRLAIGGCGCRGRGAGREGRAPGCRPRPPALAGPARAPWRGRGDR